MLLKPSIHATLQSCRAAGRTITAEHTKPCGSKFYRLDNYDIVGAGPTGESLGRLSTIEWDRFIRGA